MQRGDSLSIITQVLAAIAQNHLPSTHIDPIEELMEIMRHNTRRCCMEELLAKQYSWGCGSF